MDIPQPLIDAFGLVRAPVREASILLNDPYFALIFSLALILALSFAFREQKRLPFMAAAIVVALLLGMGMKAFLQEPRPCVETPGKIPCPLDFSLPSLHALLTFTLAILAVGNRSFAIYLIYALFTAFSRVYLGVHTVTEVMAGLALAFLACVIAEMAWRRMKWEMPESVHIRHGANRLQK
ncbi:Undecaprenyl-diphosphatase [uncultured archaeon]|nr:Undecaprenyl-diphosphatase [uncultured archaeon]